MSEQNIQVKLSALIEGAKFFFKDNKIIEMLESLLNMFVAQANPEQYQNNSYKIKVLQANVYSMFRTIESLQHKEIDQEIYQQAVEATVMTTYNCCVNLINPDKNSN